MRKLITITILILSSLCLCATHIGKASYYSNKLHGKKMANHHYYNKHKLTCAHRTYPFGTRLKIKNLKNHRIVIVTVTDRGPYIRGREVDLSEKAAQILRIKRNGVVMVSITKLA